MPKTAGIVGGGATVTASTSWAANHGTDRARLNYQATDGGSSSWCARLNDENQFLQV